MNAIEKCLFIYIMRIDKNLHCQFKERKFSVNVRIEYVYDVSISYVRDTVFKNDFNRQKHSCWRLSCQLIYLIAYFFLHYCALDHYVSICAKSVDYYYCDDEFTRRISIRNDFQDNEFSFSRCMIVSWCFT